MRRSVCSSPGNQGSASGEIELMYGVETVAGKPIERLRARSRSFMRRNRPRERP
jgi:hypothetical protein